MRKHDVWVRGHKVTVYEPVDRPTQPKWLPSGEETDKSLAQLSDEQLRNVDEVWLVPHDRPGKVAPGDYRNGKIRYFVRDQPHPQSDVDWLMQHEAGHAYSISDVWAKDPAAREAWKQAVRSDHRTVTPYGDTDEQEDFAEFILLYSMVVGTGCEASARALFPNRFREMDRLMPRRVTTHNPASAGNKY